jgi:hypothetical protein
MVEREGLEPSEGLSQINKLRITLKIRTPDFPSRAHIWHSIWHWINSVLCELLVPSHVENHCQLLSRLLALRTADNGATVNTHARI